MDAYVSNLEAAASSTPRTIGMLITATTKRGSVDAFTIGFEATPADNTLVWKAQRFSASGTATAKTAAPKDSLGPAALLTTEENASAEPTYTANTELFQQGLNQRSLARIVYAPGKELRTNLTSDHGIGWTCSHASATPTSGVTIEWEE